MWCTGLARLPPSGLHTGRSRRLALASGLIVLLSVATCGPSETDAPPAAITTSAGGSLVDLDGTRVSSGFASAVVRGGDTLVVIDGLGGAPDGSSPMTGWLASVDRPGEARVVDLTSLGPRAGIDVQWWDGEFAVAAGSCPEPVASDEDLTFFERCGSTDWDLIAIDAETDAVRTILEAVPLEPDGILSLEAATPTELLAGLGADLVTLTKDGRRTSVESPPTAPDQWPTSTAICASGDALVALTPAGFEYAGPGAAVSRSLNDYFGTSRLAGDRWERVDLPATPVATEYAAILGCADGGIVVQSIDVEMNGLELTESRAGIHVLASKPDGALHWVEVPVDRLPKSANEIREFQVVDGRIAAAVLTARPSSDEAISSALYVWDTEKNSWAHVSNTLGEWAYYAEMATAEPVFVASDSRVLRLDEPPGGPRIRIDE